LDALHAYWQVIPSVRTALFEDMRIGYSRLRTATTEIKPTIFQHQEFTAFNDMAAGLFKKWKIANTLHLKGLGKGSQPKALIETISRSLLEAFAQAPLVDAYDVFQHLMDYWAESMQDDCYLIAADGWSEAAKPKLIIDDKAKKTKTKPDMVLGKNKYTTELIPTELVIARYFAKEQAAIYTLEAEQAELEQQLEEISEEHGNEGGLLEDAKNDKDKLTKASVTARLKEIKSDNDTNDERQVIQRYLGLVEKESTVVSSIKTAKETMTVKVAAKYEQLTESEIKTLVVDDKWIAALENAVQGELDRVSQTLTGRIQELAQRYESTLPQILDEVYILSSTVNEHLKKMGASWK